MNDGYILIEERYHAIYEGFNNSRADWTIRIKTMSIIFGNEEQIILEFQNRLNTLYSNKLAKISDCKLRGQDAQSYKTKEFYIQNCYPPELSGHNGFYYTYYTVPLSSSGIEFI